MREFFMHVYKKKQIFQVFKKCFFCNLKKKSLESTLFLFAFGGKKKKKKHKCKMSFQQLKIYLVLDIR